MQNKITTTIKIDIHENGFCDVNIDDKETTSFFSAFTPLRALMAIYKDAVIDDKELAKKIDNWVTRIHSEHADVIDELMHDKIEEVAEFATTIKNSLYK